MLHTIAMTSKMAAERRCETMTMSVNTYFGPGFGFSRSPIKAKTQTLQLTDVRSKLCGNSLEKSLTSCQQIQLLSTCVDSQLSVIVSRPLSLTLSRRQRSASADS